MRGLLEILSFEWIAIDVAKPYFRAARFATFFGRDAAGGVLDLDAMGLVSGT
jgi:hypothetical protein